MFHKIILGLATVATIAAMTVAAAVIGTAAATYVIDKAALTVTVTMATPAAPQWPARYVGRFVGLS
jgi:polyisoprenoid-binding protein YceI